MPNYPMRIKCGDFELCKPKLSFDIAKNVYSVVDMNRSFFRQWLGWVDYVKRPEDEWSVVQSVAQGDTCKYFITEQQKLVGMVGVVREDINNHIMEIGYWLDKGANGRGIMTRAVKQVQDLCFGLGGANRVEIRCATNNMLSRRVPERLAYVHEGTLRSAEVLRPGVVHDIAVYSKLKSEWGKVK